MNETQDSISQWSTKTFGEAGSNLNVAKRAQLEMDELIEALEKNDLNPSAIFEIADIIIILNRLATRMGHGVLTLQQMIDYKMAVNRKRDWDLKLNRHK